MAQRLCFDERTRIEAMRGAQLSVDETPWIGWVVTGPRCIENSPVVAGLTVIVRVRLTARRASTRLGPKPRSWLVIRCWPVRSRRG